MSASKKIVMTSAEWNTSAIKFMPPKTNAQGARSINMISTTTNRAIHISTPLMMTWGISDFVNDQGESDGKYSIQLNFPNNEYATPATTEFLNKLKDFENQILDAAVKNSELWWGEELSREVAKHNMYPILKYSKNKDTKKIDLSRPPSIRAKVPCYQGKWGVEIYDTKQTMLFPSENENLTPIDFVPKMSNVACVLQCGGIWLGGKGWGVTWKLVQCIVKPNEVVSVYGKCQIQLSSDDIHTIEKQVINDVVEDEEAYVTDTVPVVAPATAPVQQSTVVDDTDDEAEPAAEVKTPEPDVKPAPVVKKIVKKPVAATVPTSEEPVSETAAPAVKKVVKKKTST